MMSLEATRFREGVAEGVSKVRNAGSRGITHVILDRTSAMILTSDPVTWGRDVTKALSVSPEFDLSVILRDNVEIVTFHEGREVVLAAIVAEFDHISNMMA